MFERNRYLVNNAEHLLAVYDDSPNGGTAYTVNFAKNWERVLQLLIPIINLCYFKSMKL